MHAAVHRPMHGLAEGTLTGVTYSEWCCHCMQYDCMVGSGHVGQVCVPLCPGPTDALPCLPCEDVRSNCAWVRPSHSHLQCDLMHHCRLGIVPSNEVFQCAMPIQCFGATVLIAMICNANPLQDVGAYAMYEFHCVIPTCLANMCPYCPHRRPLQSQIDLTCTHCRA